MDLARNTEKKFHHGWFVVRNRTPSEIVANIEDSERLEKEQAFFNEKPWNELPSNRRGTDALRAYLAELLCSRIEKGFPQLLKEITALQTLTLSELGAMGTARLTIEEKRSYLTKIAQDFKDQASHSLRGRYNSTMIAVTKLRMKIVEANESFAYDMRINGHSLPFIDQNTIESKRKGNDGFATSAHTGDVKGLFGSASSRTPAAPPAKNGNEIFSKSENGDNVRPPCSGTFAVPFCAVKEKDYSCTGFSNVFQSISSMPTYQQFSPEELRLSDYLQSHFGPSAPVRGTNIWSGSKGSSLSNQSSTNSVPGIFGSSSTESVPGIFGSSSTVSAPGIFGSSKQSAQERTPSLFTRPKQTNSSLRSDQPAGQTSDGAERGNKVSSGIYQWIREEIKASRGTELKGTLNPDVLPILFHKQVRKWSEISEKHFSIVRTVTIGALVKILRSICPDLLTQERIEYLIKDTNQLSKKRSMSQLSDRINSILTKHLQTSNPAFEQKIGEARRARFNAAIERYRSSKLTPLGIPAGGNQDLNRDDNVLVIDMRDTAALFAELHMSNSQNLEDEVHDILQAYYEIAREDFIEYVNQHIVESYLDDPQGPVMFFSPMYVAGLDNERIESLAAEDQALVEKRERKREALSRLNRAKEIAEKYSR